MNQTLFNLLSIEKKNTERLLSRAEKEHKRLPDGVLEARLIKNKYPQFVQVKTIDGKRVSNYIPKKNRKLAEQLAQKAYDRKVMDSAKKLAKALGAAVEAIQRDDLEQIYLREGKTRRNLITPHIPTDEQFVEQWYAEHPSGKNPFPMATSYTTLRGEEVRSKSEKMIADTYYTEGIPYVYEPALHLANGKTIYPDFAVLSVRDRKTRYHEHFGMMDDEEYRIRTIVKMREYNVNGFWPGNNIIFTFEGELIPFDQNELARIIEEFFRE
ncbi:MAG: hypothetical protein II134_02110 [Lachnospiraceae bacterium]|jgi:hypothetical protein|nr:hypothetical protein [Lachnospiraceae bacterium]